MGGGDIRAFVDGKVARWYDVVAWYGRPVLNLRNWLTRGDVQLDSAAREVTRDGSAISPLELRADLTLRDDERHANLLRAILARAI